MPLAGDAYALNRLGVFVEIITDGVGITLDFLSSSRMDTN